MVARFCGETGRTPTKQDDNDPQWFQTIVLKNVNVPCELKYRPKIYCEIFDEDTLKRSDSLGRFTVDAPRLKNPERDITNLRPKWYELYDAEGRKVDGEVLAAFELVAPDSSPPPPVKSIRDDWGTQWAHIVTLGLRDIQNMLGVNKPFMEFECSGQSEQIKASNFPSSRNPNFGQVSDLLIPWPEDEDDRRMDSQFIFSPNLTFTMKDSVCHMLMNTPYDSVLYNSKRR